MYETHNIFKLIIIAVLFISCHNRAKIEIKDVTIDTVTQEEIPPLPAPPTGLKVSAHLIFDDKSLSNFDVLNDSSIALWNTIIGGGDVEKPSTSTKLTVEGDLDSLGIKIMNGKKNILDEKIPKVNGDFEYTIKNTGCEKVYITITKNKKTVYEKHIPFACGE